MAVMKPFLMCASLALVCCTSAFAQTWRDDRARLCFVRPENNGAMNVLESWIRVSDYNLPVIGGQAVCLYLEPGLSELTVTSRYPYKPESKNDEACKSKPIKLSLSSNEDRTFLICPATKLDHYACGWRIVGRGVGSNAGCDDQ